MQRFAPGELEAFETYLDENGFVADEIKVHCKAPKLPLATYSLEGRGNPEAIHRYLLASPFLLLDLSTREVEGGLKIRLVLSRQKIEDTRTATEFGEASSTHEQPFKFAPEMGE